MSKSDRELSHGYARGEEWAFAEIYRRYGGPTLSYARERVESPEVAEEVTQEVFLKLYRFRSRYQPERRLDQWVWAIVRNALTDRRRRQRHDERAGYRELDREGAPPAVEELPAPGNSETALIAIERRRLWERMMRVLTLPQRRVLELRFVQQLSYAQIASRLGMSLAAVKCLAYRGRLALVACASDPAILSTSLLGS